MTRFQVKELARERGLTSEQLAIKADLRMSTVRRIWQNRVSDPSYSTLAALARALDVRIEDLIAPEPKKALEDIQTPGLVTA